MFIAGYIALALSGQWLAVTPGRDAAIFLGSGLYFAVLLSSAPRDWTRWAITALLVEVMVEICLYHTQPVAAAFDAAGHALGVLAGAHAVRACRGLPFQLTTLTDVVAFALAAAIVCPSVSIVISLVHLALTSQTFENVGWLTYWTADAVGVLVMTPLLLTVRQYAGAWRTVPVTRWFEAAVLLVALVTILHFIFSNQLRTVFLALPMIVWAATRFSRLGVVVIMLVFMVVIVRYSALGLGPYGVSAMGRTLLAQSFLALTSICALCLSAVIGQYQAAQIALRQARDELETRVLERTAALAESERRLRLGNELFAIARAAAKITTLEWVVASDTPNFSDECAWLRGPLPAGGEYPSFVEQIHPDDRAGFIDMRQRALDTLQGGTFEFRVVRTDHIVLWVQSYQTVFADGQGNGVRMVAAVQDISSRKQSEFSLRASEQRLRALLDGIPERAWLKDADGRYIAVNRALEEGVGLPESKIIGKTLFDIRPVAVAERNTAEERMVISHGAMMRFERPSNTRGTWVETTKTPIYEADGRYAGMVGIWRDISVRKLAEQQTLEDSEQRYRTLVTATSQSVWMLDAEGSLVAVLKSLSGRTISEVRGRKWLAFVHPEDRAAAEIAVQIAMSDKSIYEHEFRVLDNAGGWRDILARAVPVMHEDGSVREWIGTSTDISRQKKAELALRESNQTLRRLSGRREEMLEAERARIAHNLHDGAGQSLNVVRMKLAALANQQTEMAPRATLRELLGIIDQVNQDIRTLEFELSPPVLRQLGLVPALRWLGEEMQRIYDLKVSVSDDGNDKVLSQLNRAATFRAVRELLINVVKHAKVDAAHVDAHLVDKTVVITVSDMGIGFDAAGTQTTAALGLGLAIVRERIEFCGGRVTFDSTPGAGTVNTIIMPLSVAAVPGVEV